MINDQTIIISALWCCGKTTLYKTSTRYSIIDLDEILEIPKKEYSPHKSIPWLYYIKECIGKYDFVFLSIRREVLDTLQENHLPYILVFPENTEENKKEWERRNKERNTEWMWNINKYAWNSILENLKYDPHAIGKYELKSNQYLSDIIDYIYAEHSYLLSKIM